MADVTVKLFGVLRIDSGLKSEELSAEKLADVYPVLNERAYQKHIKEHTLAEKPKPLAFKDTVVYINGERCSKKSKKLEKGDEVWLLSPASGG